MSVALAVQDFLFRAGRRGEVWRRLPRAAAPAVILACGGVYGAIMAAHGGLVGERAWMVLYGAIKVPLLFTATLLLAIPSFYVLNVLSGVGDAFGRVWRALVDHQLAVALQLAACAPVTLLVNLSTDDYRFAQAWSTFLFAGASWTAQRVLGRSYAALEQLDPVHRRLKWAWLGLYAFVGVQMGWDLRPFVGNPAMPVGFFREDIGNAYVEIPRVLWEAVGGVLL